MKRDKEFNNILNECLERLLEGETIEQCLQKYPKQAKELKPLLETALAAKKASAIQPRADFKTRARYQFRSALKETATKRPSPLWFPRWATVATIALVLLLAGSSTVVAAGSSMPDSPLYPVKLATEETRLALTFSPLGKASFCAELADRRVAEIIFMAERGDAQQVELITRRLDERLAILVTLVSGEEGEAAMLMAPAPEETGFGKGWHGPGDNRANLRMTLALRAARHQVLFQALLEQVPEEARPALRHAIDVSAAGYQRALEALD